MPTPSSSTPATTAATPTTGVPTPVSRSMQSCAVESAASANSPDLQQVSESEKSTDYDEYFTDEESEHRMIRVPACLFPKSNKMGEQDDEEEEDYDVSRP